MSNIVIRDLDESKELDANAMSKISGGRAISPRDTLPPARGPKFYMVAGQPDDGGIVMPEIKQIGML